MSKFLSQVEKTFLPLWGRRLIAEAAFQYHSLVMLSSIIDVINIVSQDHPWAATAPLDDDDDHPRRRQFPLTRSYSVAQKRCQHVSMQMLLKPSDRIARELVNLNLRRSSCMLNTAIDFLKTNSIVLSVVTTHSGNTTRWCSSLRLYDENKVITKTVIRPLKVPAHILCSISGCRFGNFRRSC